MRKTTPVLIAAGLLLVCLLLILAIGLPRLRAEQRWSDLRARGILRIGTDPGVAVFSMPGPEGWMGYDAAVARELGARLGLRIEPVPVGYDGLYDALTTGAVDVSMSAMPPDPARAGAFAFSQPYFDAGVRLVGPRAASYRAPSDLRHSRVAVALGSDADKTALHHERRVPGFVRVPRQDGPGALGAVADGSAGWALVDGLAAAGGPCRAVEAPPDARTGGMACIALQPQPYVIAARAEDGRLLAEINRALAAMQADGTLDALWRRQVM